MRLGGSTLLQQAIERGQACGTDELMIVTSQDHLFLIKDVLKELSNPPTASFLLAPQDCTSGSAIALSALACEKQFGGDTVMLVLSPCHLVPDRAAFVGCASDAIRLAENGALVTFGVSPTNPDPSISYIEVRRLLRESQPVVRYIENPDLATAQGFLATGRYYWSSGMFCFTANAMISALERHAPHLIEAARSAFANGKNSENLTRVDELPGDLQSGITIDSAVMGSAENLHVVPANFGWSDVTSWPSVALAQTPDAGGNTMLSDVVAIDTTGTHIQMESYGPKVVATVGLRDLIIVDTPDALLVAQKSSAQQINQIVDILRTRKHEAIQLPAVVRRPWGTYASLKEEDGYKVKRITVKPGEALSLQYHYKRAEHWVVVSGKAMVQIGDVEHETLPGQYRYIPLKEKHRLTNIGTEELVLIEVQCGNYLGEDDIVRLADTYGRT